MKFGKYLETKIKEEWRANYIDYTGLKDLIKLCAKDAETGATSFSPRTTSLTVVRYSNAKDTNEEKFFKKLEQDVEKVNKFTNHLVEDLRLRLRDLASKVDAVKSEAEKAQLLAAAKKVGDDFLALEKYVNLNYMGFHKILKKHDKMVPHAPCRQFYVAHLHQQPWVQGTYSDLLVHLSNVHSKLRGDTSGQKNEDSAQGFVRSTTKYWVRNEDVSTVKHHVLQHLPVFQFEQDFAAGDAQLINSVYLDNSSLELYHGRLDKRPGAIAARIRWYGNADPTMVFMERKTHRESWKGEESVKERFLLENSKVVPFLDGEYTIEQAIEDLRSKGKTEKEIEKFRGLFEEVAAQVESKQLKPLVRTQYMRTAFQIPFDATVRVSLDTNLCMIKENPEEGPTCAVSGRWYRDPTLPIHRTEITRFPHAVLEVKLSLAEGQVAPAWVSELLESGYLTEVHKFSKFIHGTATLFPDMVRAVPYWVDDESVRSSMLASAATPPEGSVVEEAGPSARRVVEKPRKRSLQSELTHPLLGEQPTLRLMPNPNDVKGFAVRSFTGGPGGGAPAQPGFLTRLFAPKSKTPATPMRIEPKTFFANERTFLAWLHMSITLGSIAAALLGFSTAASTDPTAGLSRHLVEVIALIMLPLAVGMCGYALMTFVWRAQNIAKKRPTGFDDRVGPLCLCIAVVVALSAIFIVSIVDLLEVLDAQSGEPPAAPPLLAGFLTV